MYASPISCSQLLRNCSAMDATLDTGGWLALTRQGLSPGKHRQASLGAITTKLRGAALFATSRSNAGLGEQPTRLRILRGESPLTVSCPKRTVSISGARGGNEP